MQNTRPIGVRLPNALIDRIEAAAPQVGLSRSAMIKMAVEKYLEEKLAA